MSTTPKPALPPIPRSFVHTALIRLLMLMVLIGSVWLVKWSVMDRFQPTQRLLRQREPESARLASEVQQLEVNWNADESAKLETQFGQARQSLFSGLEECDGWQQDVKRNGQLLAFNAIIHSGTAQPHPHKDQRVSLVPVTVDLRLAPASRLTNSPYQRLLTLVKSLEQTNRRVDLVEFSVHGNSNSVQQAQAVLQLWSDDKTR